MSYSINETIDLLAPTALKKEVIIENQVSRYINITADKYMITTVIRNLISNAIKFSNIKGLIMLRSTIKSNEIILSVEDNGIGMNEVLLSKIFNLDNKDTMVGTAGEKGTGLGLLICKEFIEKNGGEILVESQEGKGTKFSFSLPYEE